MTEAEFAQLQANQRAAAGESVPPSASEAEIERDCTAWLELDGWRALRTDPVSDRKRGKGFGELGMADHLYIRYGPDLKLPPEWKKPVDHSHAQVLWIEFKRPGQHPAPHQVAWHQQERARGALTAIAGEDFPATVEGFQIWYRSSGLQRR